MLSALHTRFQCACRSGSEAGTSRILLAVCEDAVADPSPKDSGHRVCTSQLLPNVLAQAYARMRRFYMLESDHLVARKYHSRIGTAVAGAFTLDVEMKCFSGWSRSPAIPTCIL